MRLAGVKTGDEVLAPTLTFAATINPILYEHARPVFVDSEPRTWNVDVNLLADCLSERARTNRLPRAIVAVHLFGASAELAFISDLCRRYGRHAGSRMRSVSGSARFTVDANGLLRRRACFPSTATK